MIKGKEQKTQIRKNTYKRLHFYIVRTVYYSYDLRKAKSIVFRFYHKKAAERFAFIKRPPLYLHEDGVVYRLDLWSGPVRLSRSLPIKKAKEFRLLLEENERNLLHDMKKPHPSIMAT